MSMSKESDLQVTEIPDAWTLDPDEPDWLENICRLLLGVGVPPTAISRAFSVDVHAIKELEAITLVEKYGTAEISEAMNFLMWRAYSDALDILTHSPPQVRTRFITTLLSRQSVILGKQSPESLDRMRNALNDLYANIGIKDPAAGSIYAASEFVASDGNANDPEEGFEGRED
jgi:hypothetical protein